MPSGLKEIEKIDGYLDFAWELNKDLRNMGVTMIATEELEDTTEYRKSPGSPRRLTVTHTPMKDHQLTPMWNTCKV